MSNKKNNAVLKISDIKLWVHLGVSKEEKHLKQPVSIDIKIDFTTIPEAINTDNINDAICYTKIVDLINKTIRLREFNLIEYLAMEIHKSINQEIMKSNYKNSQIKVKVTKTKPPVDNIHGGVSFTFC